MDAQRIKDPLHNVILQQMQYKTSQGYGSVPALKIGRLCVSDLYNSQFEQSVCKGLGKIIFAVILGYAQELSEKVGCRLLTTHAKKTTKAYVWYEKMGFVYA